MNYIFDYKDDFFFHNDFIDRIYAIVTHSKRENANFRSLLLSAPAGFR